MICEIAVATNTTPAQWDDVDDRDLVTVVDILNKQAAAAKRARG